MNEAVLTPKRILEAAEEVLRRYGPTKATIVDVARVLGVSHGSVYRHFASKAALRDAVTQGWLDRVLTPLEEVVTEDSPAPERLRRWLYLLFSIKRRKALNDPELFATYMKLVGEAREVVKAHVDHLAEHVSRIIESGVARGEFANVDPSATARGILDATTRFHNPVHASEWAEPGIEEAFERVWELVLRGISPR